MRCPKAFRDSTGVLGVGRVLARTESAPLGSDGFRRGCSGVVGRCVLLRVYPRGG